jgi:GT2 family glycosyltransferase
LSYRPKVSIIMPVYNPDPAWLRDAIESVRAQLYDNWELCIADDASSELAVRELLQECHGDERIKVAHLKENQGISGASNAALAMGAGEYVGFLDHDDELKPDALYEVVKLLNEQPDLDFIYSDEDKRTPEGRLVKPFFKPDWSPDLLLSTNYVPHFAVYRKRLVDEVGGLRSECDFSQDYDLVLRVTERTKRIGHLALPLYTWRMVPGSAASDLEAKPKSIDAAKRALADAMQRRGIQAQVTDGLWISTYRIKYRILGEPLVSIIVPTKDQVWLLARCIDSIRRRTDYKNYEILVVDNGSVEDSTHKYLRRLAQQPGIRVLDYPQPFNFSTINNFAAQHAQGEHLLFLNNDTEVISKEWLSALLEHSQRPEVGAVGARLLYADGRLQHGGVIVGLGGVAGHAHKLLPKEQNGYFVRAKVIQNFSAVTAACLMIRADLFADLGGFDGEHLPIAFGDVDLCLRIREQGLLVVWTPYAELYHHESASRGYEDTPEKQRRFGREVEYMKAKWGDTLLNDPYYSPNLTQDREDFSLGP